MDSHHFDRSWLVAVAGQQGAMAVLVDAVSVDAAPEESIRNRETPSVFDVEVTELAGIRHARVDGVVRNNGPEPILFVKVRCALVDAATGREHDARMTYAVAGEGLPPENRRGFVVYLDRPAEGLIGYRPRCEVADWRR
jgi:hypothetical protein